MDRNCSTKDRTLSFSWLRAAAIPKPNALDEMTNGS